MAYEPECPICGHPMMSIETHPGRGELYCHTCNLVLCGDDAKTPEELVALIDGSAYMRAKAENAELVDVLHEVEEEAVYAYRCLQHDCEVAIEHSQEVFEKWWHAECERERLKELVEELLPYAGDSCPEECRYREECDGENNRGTHGLPLTCVAYGHLVEKAAKLGVPAARDMQAGMPRTEDHEAVRQTTTPQLEGHEDPARQDRTGK